MSYIFVNLSKLHRPGLVRNALAKAHTVTPCMALKRFSSSEGPIDHPEAEETIPIPEYPWKENEPEVKKRARLIYQSRKRGMLENGILLSTFAAKYLDTLNAIQLESYDKLINRPSNDWDIYHWITETKPTPDQYDTDVMKLLQKHAKNEEKQLRNRLPDLHTHTT